MKTIFHTVLIILLGATLYSCANPGMPSGGPKDEDPPVLVKSTPAVNQKNYSKPEVELFFDEIVVLKNARDFFIVSPPLEEEPEITALAKKIVIDLKNELQPNTTYTIYLGSSIVDNNEGNPLEDFTFSFSTGEVVDSMIMSGRVLRAKDLEPLGGVIVGIYSNLEDSAFIKNVPVRIARTNKNGEFSIKNIAPGTYKVYALREPIKNYRFDPGEEIGFVDSVFVPYFDTIQVSDTIWADSITVDTILWRDTLIYGPDDILLKTFEEFFLVQKLRKNERPNPYKLLYAFSSKIQEEPRLNIIGTPDNYGGFFTEYSVTGDSIRFWLTDSTIFKQDSLLVKLEYQETDSLEQLFWKTDTLMMVFRQPREKKSSRKKDDPIKEKKKTLTIQHNLKSTINLNGSLEFNFEEPIQLFDKEAVILHLKEDTLKKPIAFILRKHENSSRKFFIDYNWEGGKNYTLSIDSAGISSIYDIVSDKFSASFTVRKEDQYGNIRFNLIKPDKPGILYMLNSQGKMVREQAFEADQQAVNFNLIMPGKYYFSLFFDMNQNGKWDTGEFIEHLQPEPVRFFPKEIDVKAYRDYEEDWDTEALPLWKQKPEALIGKDDKKR